VSPQSASISSGAGTGSFNVVTSSPACAWTAVPAAPWITVTNIAGNTVSYAVAANVGSARTASISVNGTFFNINQASGCTYLASPMSFQFDPSGGQGSVSVTTDDTCA